MPQETQEPTSVRMAFEDGEIRTATFLDTLPRPPARGARRLTDTWSLIFDAGWDALIDAKITGTDYRVFAAISRRAPITGGEWELRAPFIAERLGYDTRRVHKSVQRLLAAGLLRRPRHGYIEFNPDLFWRGSSKSRVERRAVHA